MTATRLQDEAVEVPYAIRIASFSDLEPLFLGVLDPPLDTIPVKIAEYTVRSRTKVQAM